MLALAKRNGDGEYSGDSYPARACVWGTSKNKFARQWGLEPGQYDPREICSLIDAMGAFA
jgi:hypothetical protein